MNSGWFKIYRKFTEWEWWNDHNATRLFMYLLCKTNWRDTKWRGMDVPAGSLVTSWPSLSRGCGLTEKEVRTAMNKLEQSGDIERSRAGKGQLVSLVNWEKYQSDDNLGAGLGQDVVQEKGRQPGRKRAGSNPDQSKAAENAGQEKGRQPGRKRAGNRAPDEEVKNIRSNTPPTPSKDECKLMTWVKINTPTILKMKKPLTDDQARKIMEDYIGQGAEVRDVLESMENKPSLLKDYKSSNLTIRKWLKGRNITPKKPAVQKPVAPQNYGKSAVDDLKRRIDA